MNPVRLVTESVDFEMACRSPLFIEANFLDRVRLSRRLIETAEKAVDDDRWLTRQTYQPSCQENSVCISGAGPASG